MAISNHTTSIPYGYCHCGCGQKTNIYKHTHIDRGQFKGQPALFIKGHFTKAQKRVEQTILHNGEIAFCKIPLTHGQVTIVDMTDSDLARFNWHAAHCPEYSGGDKFRARRMEARHSIFMHRVIMSRMLDRELLPHEKVDHVDTNPLNNRRENLRLATSTQNNANQNRRRDNTSGFKGVRYSKNAKRWAAAIQTKGNRKHLGYFDTPEQAYEAYCAAAKEFFGEFARLE